MTKTCNLHWVAIWLSFNAHHQKTEQFSADLPEFRIQYIPNDPKSCFIGQNKGRKPGLKMSPSFVKMLRFLLHSFSRCKKCSIFRCFSAVRQQQHTIFICGKPRTTQNVVFFKCGYYYIYFPHENGYSSGYKIFENVNILTAYRKNVQHSQFEVNCLRI